MAPKRVPHIWLVHFESLKSHLYLSHITGTTSRDYRFYSAAEPPPSMAHIFRDLVYWHIRAFASRSTARAILGQAFGIATSKVSTLQKR